MLKKIAVVMLSSALLLGCATTSVKRTAVRIDASSIESAETSYKAMMRDRSEPDQQKLALAVLMLNMEGVKSVYVVVGNPELQSPSIGRIRAKVAGMTAEEIMELAARNPSGRIEVLVQ